MPTHGSLAKAGKMRFVLHQQREWRVESKERETKKYRKKKHQNPIRRNRINYMRRIIYAKTQVYDW